MPHVAHTLCLFMPSYCPAQTMATRPSSVASFQCCCGFGIELKCSRTDTHPFDVRIAQSLSFNARSTCTNLAELSEIYSGINIEIMNMWCIRRILLYILYKHGIYKISLIYSLAKHSCQTPPFEVLRVTHDMHTHACI